MLWKYYIYILRFSQRVITYSFFRFLPVFLFYQILYALQVSFSALSSISTFFISRNNSSILFQIPTRLAICSSHSFILPRYAGGKDVPHLYISHRLSFFREYSSDFYYFTNSKLLILLQFSSLSVPIPILLMHLDAQDCLLSSGDCVLLIVEIAYFTILLIDAFRRSSFI